MNRAANINATQARLHWF